MKDEVEKRIQAVQRFFAGEKPEAICASIGDQDPGSTNGSIVTPRMMILGAIACQRNLVWLPTVRLQK